MLLNGIYRGGASTRSPGTALQWWIATFQWCLHESLRLFCHLKLRRKQIKSLLRKIFCCRRFVRSPTTHISWNLRSDRKNWAHVFWIFCWCRVPGCWNQFQQHERSLWENSFECGMQRRNHEFWTPVPNCHVKLEWSWKEREEMLPVCDVTCFRLFTEQFWFMLWFQNFIHNTGFPTMQREVFAGIGSADFGTWVAQDVQFLNRRINGFPCKAGWVWVLVFLGNKPLHVWNFMHTEFGASHEFMSMVLFWQNEAPLVQTGI